MSDGKVSLVEYYRRRLQENPEDEDIKFKLQQAEELGQLREALTEKSEEERKLYVAEVEDKYEGSSSLGVFSTRRLAEEACEANCAAQLAPRLKGRRWFVYAVVVDRRLDPLEQPKFLFVLNQDWGSGEYVVDEDYDSV